MLLGGSGGITEDGVDVYPFAVVAAMIFAELLHAQKVHAKARRRKEIISQSLIRFRTFHFRNRSRILSFRHAA